MGRSIGEDNDVVAGLQGRYKWVALAVGSWSWRTAICPGSSPSSPSADGSALGIGIHRFGGGIVGDAGKAPNP